MSSPHVLCCALRSWHQPAGGGGQFEEVITRAAAERHFTALRAENQGNFVSSSWPGGIAWRALFILVGISRKRIRGMAAPSIEA